MRRSNRKRQASGSWWVVGEAGVRPSSGLAAAVEVGATLGLGCSGLGSLHAIWIAAVSSHTRYAAASRRAARAVAAGCGGCRGGAARCVGPYGGCQLLHFTCSDVQTKHELLTLDLQATAGFSDELASQSTAPSPEAELPVGASFGLATCLVGCLQLNMLAAGAIKGMQVCAAELLYSAARFWLPWLRWLPWRGCQVCGALWRLPAAAFHLQ